MKLSTVKKIIGLKNFMVVWFFIGLIANIMSFGYSSEKFLWLLSFLGYITIAPLILALAYALGKFDDLLKDMDQMISKTKDDMKRDDEFFSRIKQDIEKANLISKIRRRPKDDYVN